MQYAIVKNNVVVNVIALDDPEKYAQPQDCILVENETCGIGDIYDAAGGTFTKPESA